MDDFFDDFDGEFMDDGSFEEKIEEQLDDDSGGDELSMKDFFIIGGALGWAYEEGLEERRRRESNKME